MIHTVLYRIQHWHDSNWTSEDLEQTILIIPKNVLVYQRRACQWLWKLTIGDLMPCLGRSVFSLGILISCVLFFISVYYDSLTYYISISCWLLLKASRKKRSESKSTSHLQIISYCSTICVLTVTWIGLSSRRLELLCFSSPPQSKWFSRTRYRQFYPMLIEQARFSVFIFYQSPCFSFIYVTFTITLVFIIASIWFNCEVFVLTSREHQHTAYLLTEGLFSSFSFFLERTLHVCMFQSKRQKSCFICRGLLASLRPSSIWNGPIFHFLG
jgi:hypothetical protein